MLSESGSEGQSNLESHGAALTRAVLSLQQHLVPEENTELVLSWALDMHVVALGTGMKSWALGPMWT